MIKIKIKRYNLTYLTDVMNLHHDTIHTVCRDLYTPEQLEAWAPTPPDLGAWLSSFSYRSSYVALHKNKVVGFCDMADDGFINRIYTHKDYQSQGIGSLLLKELEKRAVALRLGELKLEASLVGLKFYQNRGFVVVKEQTKTFRGVLFKNYLMVKKLEY